MAERKFETINCEIECLNLDDLDVEELERRLEMSTGVGVHAGMLVCSTDGVQCADASGCGTDCGTNCGTNICGADCGSNCVGNCAGNCIVNGCGCDSACGIDLY